MMEALKYSPLYVAGFAWSERDGLYRSYAPANHAFTVVGYVEGSHWLAFDSYFPFIKKLAWDYQFNTAYIIFVDDIDEEYNREAIKRLRDRGFRYIMRTDKVGGGKGEVYELTENNELRELTQQEKINEAVRQMATKQDLTGISELDYFRLLK